MSLEVDCDGDWTAQERRGGDMDVVGRPWSARPIWRERWMEERGRERSHTNEKYCKRVGVVLHTDVCADSGRARLWLVVWGVGGEKQSWEEAREDRSSS